MSKNEAIARLIDAGCEHLTREDRDGKTRSGWWQDDVWLAPYSQPVQAWQVINGN